MKRLTSYGIKGYSDSGNYFTIAGTRKGVVRRLARLRLGNYGDFTISRITQTKYKTIQDSYQFDQGVK